MKTDFNSTEIILESISDGVFTVDNNWKITSFNRAAEQITGISREEAIGRQCSEVFRASMCESDCALGQTMQTGKPVINKSAFIIDVKGQKIPISVSTAILRDEHGNILGGAETFRDLSDIVELRKTLQKQYQIGDMISRSNSMHKVFELIPLIANSQSTVLIQGETGTGKELLARTIHHLSDRQKKPFVAVNCGALPDTLLESELFGYKAGAFTGASKDKPGRFDLARGGTMLLDEIGEMSLALQIRLLRVLQNKTYEPLGGTKSVHSDVRVIAATNKDLTASVEQGTFRADLFYRINVVRVDLPPLRKRKEDIPLLIDHFINHFNKLQGKSVTDVDPEVITILMSHNYPGNIRELENIIEHAFILVNQGMIHPEHLPEEFAVKQMHPEVKGKIGDTLKMVEAQTIRQALSRNNNNRLKTAEELGIHKSTLFRKMKQLGISFPEKDGRFKA